MESETTSPVEQSPPTEQATAPVALRPRRCTEHELAKFGVELLDERSLLLGCVDCGQQWSPMLRSGGRLPRGYWKCPRCYGVM